MTVDFEELIKNIGEASPTMLPAILGAVVETATKRDVFQPGMMLRLVARVEVMSAKTPEERARLIFGDEPQNAVMTKWAQSNTAFEIQEAIVQALRVAYNAGKGQADAEHS